MHMQGFLKNGDKMISIKIASVEHFEVLKYLERHIEEEILKKKIENGEIFIIFENGKILGWLRYNMFWDEHPFMNMLFIIETQRNKGYGKKLVQFWEDEMIKNGSSILMISTMSNESSQHFYRSIGYHDIGGFILPDEPLELMMIKKIDKA